MDSHIAKLLADIAQNKTQDVTIKCSDGDVTANSFMMAIRSISLHQLIKVVNDAKEIDLTKYAQRVVGIFIMYVNTGKVEGFDQCTIEKLFQLKNLATEFSFNLLSDDVDAVLDKRSWTVKSAFEILKYAKDSDKIAENSYKIIYDTFTSTSVNFADIKLSDVDQFVTNRIFKYMLLKKGANI
jgi:hypothetical protein